MQIDRRIAPSELMAFVAHDPATGRAVEQVPDHPRFQDLVGQIVVAWMRSGAKVEYLPSDPTLVRVADDWLTIAHRDEPLAASA